METLEIKICKKDRKQAWGEHLVENGFERDSFENKYRKKIVIWSRGGLDYVASPSSDSEGNLILTLKEYA